MLAIRLQRTGRHGHAMFRVIVQEAQRTPSSGKVVALLGSYDPHSKTSSLNKEKASYYLEHGAQPSERVVRLFKAEKITLPKWVDEPLKKSRSIRNQDKLRKNAPVQADEPKSETATDNQQEQKAEAEEVTEVAENSAE